MSFSADIPQNINILPIPVERVVETPKPEPGKNNVDNSALEFKNQKSKDQNRINPDDEQKSRKHKKDTYNKNAKTEDLEESAQSGSLETNADSREVDQALNTRSVGQRLDIIG